MLNLLNQSIGFELSLEPKRQLVVRTLTPYSRSQDLMLKLTNLDSHKRLLEFGDLEYIFKVISGTGMLNFLESVDRF